MLDDLVCVKLYILLNAIIRDSGEECVFFILMCMWNPPKALLSVFLSMI